jgi:hypothetical protein
MLLKFKKNQIFEAIQAARLDAQEFDLEDARTEVRIKHRWSKSYFIIGGDPGHYVGLDHGVGYSLLLLYDVKVPNSQKSKEFKDLGHCPSDASLRTFQI